MARIRRKPKTKSDSDLFSLRWWLEKWWIPIAVGLVLALFNKFSKDDNQPGKLQVLCNVDSADVLINGDSRGISAIGQPVVFELMPGQYVVGVEKQGYAIFKHDVAIASDQPTTVDAVLTRALLAPTPTLPVDRIESKQTGVRQDLIITVPDKFKNAKIFLDREWIANAPATISVAKGQHLLRVQLDEFFFEEMIQIPSKRQLINVMASEFQSNGQAKK